MGETVAVDRNIAIACDSHISWCRHRHENDPDIQREMDGVIAYLRKLVAADGSSETEPQRTNRVMREVLTKHLSQLTREARKQGWA